MAQEFFAKAWNQYIDTSPQVKNIHSLLEQKLGHIENDHIALRTLDHFNYNMEGLCQFFSKLGYTKVQNYKFEQKKLDACHLEKEDYPKIFISQLRVKDLSQKAQDILLTLDYEKKSGDSWQFFDRPRAWDISLEKRNLLLQESEYAAWFYTFGIIPNHFTIAVHKIKNNVSLENVNELILSKDIQLNSSGGLIKGTRESGLRQSSTLADQRRIDFEDGSEVVPTVYYEFAQRYVMSDGKYFSGFRPKSADKIFESTNKQ